VPKNLRKYLPGESASAEKETPLQAAQRLQDSCVKNGEPKACEHWIRILREGCNAESSEACILLAGHTLNGLKAGETVILEPDPNGAVAIFKKHCDAGHRPGCEALAALYYQGLGVARDPDRAAELLCAGGKMTKLPAILSTQCTRGDETACAVLQKCCAMGNKDACGNGSGAGGSRGATQASPAP
jgi:hypothetical protein